MDDKKKILLGEKDILSKDNEDLFINLNLNTTFSEIRNDKYENVFDISKQFDKERNASRDFRIYGIIDSTVADCDNLKIFAYSTSTSGTGINSGATILGGLVKTFSSTTLVYKGLNAYGKKRGKYILELTGYTNDFIYIKIPSNKSTFKDQIYSQQLIFRDADDNFVDYGTQTIDISENGEAIDINNDFYFLYNKHWIKKDLAIVEEKPARVFFNASSSANTVSESATGNDFFNITLDKPSPFGLEKVDIGFLSKTLDLTEISIRNQNNILLSMLPTTVSFQKGEQVKGFSFNSSIDFLQELVENVTLELNNFQFVNTGTPLTHTIFVTDATPRNRVKLNFQNIYQNRNYFTGKVGVVNNIKYSYPYPAVLRNGLNYEGSPMEFYPIDGFNLKIKNIGIDTILPVNNILGITAEQIFTAGQELFFNINTQYTNIERHSVKFYFARETSTTLPYIVSINSGATINGVPIIDYSQTYKVDYEHFLAAFKNLPVTVPIYNTLRHVSGWHRYNLDIPFEVVENLTALTITITAKSPGTRLDIKSYNFPDFFDTNDPRLQTLGITAVTIQDFVQSAQTPLEIVLGANVNSNSQAQYAFEISKTGYDKMTFTSTTMNAAVVPTPHYLVAGFNNVLRGINSAGNAVYVHSGVTSNWPYQQSVTTGFYTNGEAYVNGILFLSNLYYDRTANTAAYFPGLGSLNQSHFTNASGDFRADFLPSPIATIADVSETYSPQTKSQIGYLGIRDAQSNPTQYVNSVRYFDFKTGSTAPFNTYYFDSPTYIITHAAWIWGPPLTSYNYFFSSGGTPGTNSLTQTLPLKYYMQDGYVPGSITSQGMIGTTPIDVASATLLNNARGNNFFTILDFIKLESATSGTSFEFKNFIEMKWISTQENFSNDTMFYIETQPYEVAGVTINKANNFLQGFSLAHP